jgi:cytochrome P450 family 135
VADLPPGPRLPAVLQGALAAREPYGWMLRRWRRYGDCFSGRFPGFGRVVYLADPAAVKELLLGEPAVFRAGEANPSALGPALGSYSLLTLDRDEHLSQRKLLQMKVILRTILRRARLRAADPRPERPRVRHVTAVPGQGARAVLQERVPSGAPRAPLAAAV